MKNQINKVNVEKAVANSKANSLIALDVLKSCLLYTSLNFLMGLLIKLEDDYKLNCLDINQVQIYDTTYYSFIFESIITASSCRSDRQDYYS